MRAMHEGVLGVLRGMTVEDLVKGSPDGEEASVPLRVVGASEGGESAAGRDRIDAPALTSDTTHTTPGGVTR